MKKNVLLLIITLSVFTQCRYSELDLLDDNLYVQVFADSSDFRFDEIKGDNQKFLPEYYQEMEENILLINLPIDRSRSSCAYVFRYKNKYDTLIFEYNKSIDYIEKNDAFSTSISNLVVSKHTFQNATVTIDHWDFSSKYKVNKFIYAKIYY